MSRRRTGLTIALAVLLAPIAGFTAARWFAGHRSEPTEATQAAPPGRAAGEEVTPSAAAAATVPLLVGDTGSIAAAAIDDTAGIPTNRALIALARRYLGTPYAANSLDRDPQERLRLDLTHFDCFLFVEQLLALVNSRRVSTRTEAVQQFGEHVRRLRYEGGRVDYCHRHHYFSRWAAAAEEQGYLVNLAPFLPGAVTRDRPLTYLSSHSGSSAAQPTPRQRDCIAAREKSLSVRQTYLPLARLPESLPSLRSGDVFALVTKARGLDVSHVGLLEVEGGHVDAIHAAPGRGVMRSQDLVPYAAGVNDVIGVMVLRPMPRREGPGT